jgi:hypothetical protein
LEDDLVAGEALELVDEVALVALLVDARFVEVWTEVVVAGLRVGEQVPDDGQDRVADGDDGAALAAMFDQAPIAFGEEGIGAAGSGDDLAERAAQPRVALTGGGTLGLAG